MSYIAIGRFIIGVVLVVIGIGQVVAPQRFIRQRPEDTNSILDGLFYPRHLLSPGIWRMSGIVLIVFGVIFIGSAFRYDI